MKGRCGHNESELQVFWVDKAYALKMLFVKVTPGPGCARGRFFFSGIRFPVDCSIDPFQAHQVGNEIYKCTSVHSLPNIHSVYLGGGEWCKH